VLRWIIISLRWQWYLSGRSTSVHWSKNCCGSASGWKPIHSPCITQTSRSVDGRAVSVLDVIYYSCCCCCSCNSATGSVRCTACTKYFYCATLCCVGICHGGPVSVHLFVTSRSPAHNSRLQSRARIYAHSRWRCLNVLLCALQMAEPIDGKASNRLRYTLSVLGSSTWCRSAAYSISAGRINFQLGEHNSLIVGKRSMWHTFYMNEYR